MQGGDSGRRGGFAFARPQGHFRGMHVNSFQRWERELVDSRTSGLLSFVDLDLRQCDVCRASDRSPHLPIAGTSQASSFDEEPRADFLSATARLRRMRRKCFLSSPFRYQSVQIHCNCAGCGSRFPVGQNAFRWMGLVNGETKFGRISARVVA